MKPMFLVEEKDPKPMHREGSVAQGKERKTKRLKINYLGMKFVLCWEALQSGCRSGKQKTYLWETKLFGKPPREPNCSREKIGRRGAKGRPIRRKRNPF
jgi:hypothetical protein